VNLSKSSLPLQIQPNFFIKPIFGILDNICALWNPPIDDYHTIISSGDNHLPMFWFSLAELRCSTPVTAQDERSFNVLIKNVKDTKKEGQKGPFIEFTVLDQVASE